MFPYLLVTFGRVSKDLWWLKICRFIHLFIYFIKQNFAGSKATTQIKMTSCRGLEIRLAILSEPDRDRFCFDSSSIRIY